MLPFFAALLALFAAIAPAFAQTKSEIVPDTWQGDVLRPKPDLHNLEKLRFVTDSDYPPFHYFDEEGVLTGFNVDLARAICETLGVDCDVRPVDWDDLFSSLDKDETDAAIASIRIDAQSLNKADFTERYYATPARFVARKDSDLKDVRPETVEGKKIGVAHGTGHEAYLKRFFPAAEAQKVGALQGQGNFGNQEAKTDRPVSAVAATMQAEFLGNGLNFFHGLRVCQFGLSGALGEVQENSQRDDEKQHREILFRAGHWSPPSFRSPRKPSVIPFHQENFQWTGE